MELYFKDLESNGQYDEDAAMTLAAESADSHDDTADDDAALAELSERVYAAGLVY